MNKLKKNVHTNVFVWNWNGVVGHERYGLK